MPTKKRSGRPLMPSSESSTKRTTPRGRRILAGLNELKDHLEGKTKLRVYHYNVPAHIDVSAIRVKTGMSQAEFSAKFAISPRTLQDWEQGRRTPDSTVRAYLTVIERDQKAVERALSGTRTSR